MESITVSVGVSNENGIDFPQPILGKPFESRRLESLPSIDYDGSTE